MRLSEIPARFVVGTVIYVAAMASAIWLVMAEQWWMQAVGVVLILSIVVCWLTLPVLDALRMERHVEQNPHLLKNDAIGEVVTVVGEFELKEGALAGVVLLHGEKWNAHCASDLQPVAGDRLCVRGRDGLTLKVWPIE